MLFKLTRNASLFILVIVCTQIKIFAQHLEFVDDAEPQPLMAQALRLNDALSFLGSALSKEDAKRLKALQDKPLTGKLRLLFKTFSILIALLWLI